MSGAKNVGICAMEVYIPPMFVSQAEMEKYDKVSTGKYQIGLGQTQMSFVSDREDVNSMCLTVVQQLLEKYNIPHEAIGRMEVGTETIMDKAKGVKTILMQLFDASGNTSLEGVDCVNACYGGTAALFNSVAWVESSAWDGRYALVVMADIAVYAAGPARPSGGAGAIALLIGPDAPLVMEPHRGSHFEHAYDFYKPDLASEYPTVDGHVSIFCYLRAVERCVKSLSDRVRLAEKRGFSLREDRVKFQCFHQPFAKMVQKAWARLVLTDFLQNPSAQEYEDLRNVLQKNQLEMETVSSWARPEEKAKVKVDMLVGKARANQFRQECEPAMALAKRTGNAYTGSLYLNLITLFTDLPGRIPISDMTVGDRIFMFSYGSGSASTAFLLRLNKPHADPAMVRMLSVLQEVSPALAARRQVAPEDYTRFMELREKAYNTTAAPMDSIDELQDGAFYLAAIDNKFRRSYLRKPLAPATKSENRRGDSRAPIAGKPSVPMSRL